ncbi:ABC transporter substrate-binding protein [Alicyclobacillus fastidiosus]|uniref:Sugar ABC transporter substrate-binding protein n=1 Tax=Alicyclobacillus fastidiosus TaxID=392011 RepID=A0ABV5A952_9BACL|nr:sugar ABC transporter substrate-binding protein [Alicyclobacillus fastidiosus]WEH12002.1 sugar ABC transporter substrate-binding protein [Alicyclobacillus fastidiosus]
MKKLFMAGLSTALVVSLAGCGQSGGSAGASNDSGKKVTISFTWWGDPTRNKVYDQVIAEFEKKYPNITVKAEPTSWADYWTKLSTEMAGGNAPDVIGMHADYASDYARRGTLLNLNSYISSGVINLSDFPQTVTDSGKLNGNTYMVAQGVTTSGQIYNEALFKQMGVSAPTMNWTWDDFVKDATALKQAFVAKGEGTGHWGVDDESGEMQPVFEYYLNQHGKQLFTSDGKLGFTVNDLESWFTMWANLRKQGVIPDAATAAQYTGASVEQSLFANDKVGITAIPANQLYLYQTQMTNTTVGLVREPSTAGGKNGEFVEGAYLAVPEKSPHPKEAAEFINFFVNDTGAGKTFKIEQGEPGSTKIDQIVKPLLTPTEQTEMSFISKTLSLAHADPYPPKGNDQITTDFTQAAQNIAYGKMSIQQASENFMNQANSILAGN